jgi:hypothetical protein
MLHIIVFSFALIAVLGVRRKIMNPILIESIHNKKVLSLSYDGLAREVEPHAYGVSTKGNDILRCYQTKGLHISEKPHDWDLLTVSKITNLRDAGSNFESPRHGYKRNDKAMVRIYAQL